MLFETFLRNRRPVVIGAAVLLPLIACALLALVRDEVANADAALLLVLLVVAAAATGIRVAGLLAALSGTAWFDFFLTEPYGRFAILDRGDLETAVLLVLVGAAVSEIALWGRRNQARASREQGYLDGVLTAVAGAGATAPEEVVEQVTARIVEILRIDACRHDTGTEPVLATLDDGHLTYDGHPHDVARLGLPTDTEIEVPIHTGGPAAGRLLLVSTSRVVRATREQLRVAGALAEQIGVAQGATAARDGRPA